MALILNVLVNVIMQKELIITDNILICKYNKRKSKEILIRDISSVEISRSGLKLNGNGVKFKLFLISNAEDLKSAIMERKN